MSADSPEPPAGTRVPVPHAVNGGAPSGQRGRVVSQSYRGLPIYAAQGHHEECFAMLGPWLRPGDSCLDLGAGSGAFARRMADAGYDVQANDLDPSSYGAKEVPFWSLDLNRPVPEQLRGRRFDLVIAMELIEHLRDPIGFLEICRSFCKPGGMVLLTTPNTVDPISSCLFLKRGEYQFFNRQDYKGIGHITILPHWLLESHLERVGLETVQRTSVGCNSPGKRRFARVLRWILERILGSRIPPELKSGDCIAYLLRNPDHASLPERGGTASA